MVAVVMERITPLIGRLRLSVRGRSRLVRRWLYDRLPDRYVHHAQFKRKFGRRLNLATPRTFNEKLHWLMLHYRIPELTRIADKYDVRGHVMARGCASLLNELYGVWHAPEAMAAAVDTLPKAFVLKVTSGSGQNILCRDKSKLGLDGTVRQLAAWMRRSEYWVSREWCYKHITPRIVCERFLTDESGGIPPDYKFFCFDGEPRVVQVDTDRFTARHRRDLFDPYWKELPFSLEYPRSERPVPPPQNLGAMIAAARDLSWGFPFVRVDLYSIRQRIVFGEMTWYPEGGLGRFCPDSYDFVIGQALKLPRPSRSLSRQARGRRAA